MKLKLAAEKCKEFISATENNVHNGCTNEHLTFMIDSMVSGAVSGEKAHRWLGYLQGVLVATGAASLEQMKDVNKGCL